MMGRRACGLVVAAALLLPGYAAAQSDSTVSLLGNVGLGRPLQPLDARARGLGGAAVALQGTNLSMVNPASTRSIPISGVFAVFSPESRTVNGLIARGDITTADFPLARMVMPFRGSWAIGVGFGSYLIQDWAVQFVDTMPLTSGPVAYRETRTSTGGISQLRVDLAHTMSPKLDVGIAGIYYFGKTALSVERDFEASVEFTNYKSDDAIEYDGLGIAVGAEWHPLPEMVVGLAGNWGGDLHAKADSSGTSKDFGIPLGLDLGASWRLTPDFVLALAGGWTNWSALSGELPKPGASDDWRFAVGTELKLIGNQSTRIDGRLGGHLEQLPFRLKHGAPWERSVTVGLGGQFHNGLGRMDIAAEFGKRGQKDTNEVEESFTRWTFTLGVFTR